MNNQTTKIRTVPGERFTGLTDLEFAKIKVADAKYQLACEAFYNGTDNSTKNDLNLAEYKLHVEEILAVSESGRRVEDDETETTVLIGDLLSIAKSLKDGTEYLRDPYRFHVHLNANKIQALAGVEVTS